MCADALNYCSCLRQRLKQDFFYLLDYVSYKYVRAATIPDHPIDRFLTLSEHESKSIEDDIGYAQSFRKDTLMSTLNISAAEIDHGQRNDAELSYSSWLEHNPQVGWFAMHVMAIPCIYVRLEAPKD